MNTIQCKGKIYVFPQNCAEPPKIYTDRLWFIIRNKEKGSFQHVVNLSHIWANHKYYQLEYDPKIMEQLQEFI